VLSLQCTWARHLKTRTQRIQAIWTSVLPASKTPVNQKIYHPNPLHLYPAQTRKRTKKCYRILISGCWTTDIRLFDFYRKRGLGPDQSHYTQSRLWPRLHTTLAQITRIVPNWIYTVFKIFSPFTIFALALKRQSCPEFFHCVEYIFCHSAFLSNFVLALKNRVAQKFFTVLNILFTFRSFSNLRLPWKTELPWNSSLYWICIFIIQDSWATCACPEKTEVPWNFSLHRNIFYHSGFLSNSRLPWKQSLPWKFSSPGLGRRPRPPLRMPMLLVFPYCTAFL